MKNWSHIREVFRNIGAKSIIAAVIVFFLTVSATFIGGLRLYNSTVGIFDADTQESKEVK